MPLLFFFSFPHIVNLLIKLIWETQLWLLGFVIKSIWRGSSAVLQSKRGVKYVLPNFHLGKYNKVVNLLSLTLWCVSPVSEKKTGLKNAEEVITHRSVIALRFYTFQGCFFLLWNHKQPVHSNLLKWHFKKCCNQLLSLRNRTWSSTELHPLLGTLHSARPKWCFSIFRTLCRHFGALGPNW